MAISIHTQVHRLLLKSAVVCVGFGPIEKWNNKGIYPKAFKVALEQVGELELETVLLKNADIEVKPSSMTV